MFFSVKTPMKIGNKTYRTCICYNLTETVKPAVEKLVAQGKATIYNEQKFFCNGKLVEKKKTTRTRVKKETVKVEETAKVEEPAVETEIKEEDF